MTTYGYNMVMLSANIATLKAKLSFYLSRAKQGEEILVLERKTPIARIIASSPETVDFKIRPASRTPGIHLKGKAPASRRKIDVVKLLRDDRDRR